MKPEEKKSKYIYTINDLTAGEIRSIEYAYGQFIHNAVSGDFAETNAIMDAFRARITKKPQRTSIPATEGELERINRKTVWIKNKRNFECMGHVLANDKIIDENWLVFNPDTKCWEDWEGK